jgi:murein DD-endopeptidase MepM/ murein hydrolase activator NlpD
MGVPKMIKRTQRSYFRLKSSSHLKDLLGFLHQRLRVVPLSLIVSLVAIALLGALLTHPVQAFQATVTPTQPKLGDTLSVVVNGDINGTPPKVRMGGKTYPMFPTSNGQFRTLLPTTPLDKPGALSIQLTNGSNAQTLSVKLGKRWFPTQSIWLPPGKDGDISDAEFDKVDAFKQIVSPDKYWNGKLLRPNGGGITSIYGIRRYYNGVFAKDYYHRGVDYGGAYGSPVVAPAAGRVALVGRESQGFKVHGNCVGIDHGQGVESIMIHLSKINVKPGDMVKAGQTIGALGGTGAATGPHLHWGLYVFGKSVDPVPWREKGFG